MKYKSNKHIARPIALIAAAILICTAYFVYPQIVKQSEPADGEAYFYFIDVGQGDSELIVTKGGTVMIDCGPNDAQDAMLSFVKSHTDKIDYLILSHPHEDHIGGADRIFENVKVENVIMPDAVSDSAAFSAVLDGIEESGANALLAKDGDKYEIGDLHLTLLAPNSASYEETNNYSVVVRADFGATSFLYTGDAEDVSEKEMLASHWRELDCDVLKVGHHGSSTSTTDDFLRAVSPSIAVIEVGEDNSYNHPSSKTLGKLDTAGCTVYRTDTDGTVTLVSDGTTIEREQ